MVAPSQIRATIQRDAAERGRGNSKGSRKSVTLTGFMTVLFAIRERKVGSASTQKSFLSQREVEILSELNTVLDPLIRIYNRV